MFGKYFYISPRSVPRHAFVVGIVDCPFSSVCEILWRNVRKIYEAFVLFASYQKIKQPKPMRS